MVPPESTTTQPDAHEVHTVAHALTAALHRAAPHAHWALRFAIASVFLYHGPQKLTGPAMMGFSHNTWILVGLAETAAGALVFYGGFGHESATRIGALLVIPVMLGAIIMVHAANGWNFMAGGMEFQVTLALIAAYLALTGNHKPRPE